MKKRLIAVLGAVTLGATLPAIAGPDFQLVERGRKAKLEAHERLPQRMALPLDHGPRPQTTPWLNQQRALRAEAQAGALAAGSIGGAGQVKHP